VVPEGGGKTTKNSLSAAEYIHHRLGEEGGMVFQMASKVEGMKKNKGSHIQERVRVG